MIYKQINAFLMRKILFCFVILWSVISFSANNSYTISSEDNHCRQLANYEIVKQRIEDFQNYHSIDDTIEWWEINSTLLSQLDNFNFWRLSNFLINIRILNMTISLVNIPQESYSAQERSFKVWLAFSPLGLPRESHRFYPKIPLVCDISENNDGVTHICEQTAGLAYAFESFSSRLTVTKNISNNCITSSYKVDFALDPQHIDNIYNEVARRYPLLTYNFLSQFNRQPLFSLYFKHLYDELLSI